MAVATDGAAGAPTPARPHRAALRLPPVPASAPMGRELIRSLTGRPENPNAALVVTELVTNAVRHGGSQLELTVEWDGTTVTVEVRDDGAGRPVEHPLLPSGDLRTSGRGLALVAQLADAWGVARSRAGPGKAVWARVTLG